MPIAYVLLGPRNVSSPGNDESFSPMLYSVDVKIAQLFPRKKNRCAPLTHKATSSLYDPDYIRASKVRSAVA